MTAYNKGMHVAVRYIAIMYDDVCLCDKEQEKINYPKKMSIYNQL